MAGFKRSGTALALRPRKAAPVAKACGAHASVSAVTVVVVSLMHSVEREQKPTRGFSLTVTSRTL